MVWLLLGLLIWVLAHFFKRVAPKARERLGRAGQPLVAVAVVVSILFMTIGYRAMEVTTLWELGTWAITVNNVLMVIAIALFFLRDSGSRLTGILRHPMLTGFLFWVVAHLLVNGDVASLILFGGLGLWAKATIIIVNRAEPDARPARGGTVQGDIKLVIMTLVIMAVVAGVHTWLGRWPFPG